MNAHYVQVQVIIAWRMPLIFYTLSQIQTTTTTINIIIIADKMIVVYFHAFEIPLIHFWITVKTREYSQTWNTDQHHSKCYPNEHKYIDIVDAHTYFAFNLFYWRKNFVNDSRMGHRRTIFLVLFVSWGRRVRERARDSEKSKNSKWSTKCNGLSQRMHRW